MQITRTTKVNNITHEQLMTFKLTVKVVPMTTLCGTDSTMTFTSP